MNSTETEYAERDGKLLVPRITKDEDVSFFITSKVKDEKILFEPESSYLLVGGLRGLGRNLAEWMVLQGAKYLVITSPRGIADPNATPLQERLIQAGAETVHIVACDVSKPDDLSKLLAEVQHPIRGVINCAMRVHNEFFSTLPLEKYLQSLAAKVDGTWSLKSLPLDFMILLSSVIGTMGNASQAAYAGASTFLDAFASYLA